ncbi:MAG: AsmA family protein, partial [Azonexus sp.]|nr:AsmA family protein [Azonexus sp.]
MLLYSRRIKRFGLWILAIFVAFGLFGYFAGPPIIKSVLVKQLSQQLHREVSIDQVALNPYALSAQIDGFSVKSAEGREVVGFDRLAVNLSSASLFKAALVVDAIRLDGPRLEVVHEGDGRYDISDLIDEWSKPSEEPSTTPRFSLNNIEMNNGRIVFDDRPKGVRHEVSDINLGLPFLSSLPYQAELLVQPHFSARADGSLIEMQGR